MNITNKIGITTNGFSKDEAVEYLTNKYVGCIYNEGDDTFSYNGYKFNYFMSGISMNEKPNHYTLVDFEDSSNWLFQYENDDDRFEDFLKRKKNALYPTLAKSKETLLSNWFKIF